MASTIYLPFLRPLRLARLYNPSSFFSRSISVSPCLQSDAVNAKTASLELTPPPPLPYYVYRTASQQLPVYQIAKRGGNLHQTRIRKINGDIKKLRDDIQKALELKEGNIAINSITGHIIIKGHLRNDVMKFLENSGF